SRRFAADNIEGKRGSCPKALPCEDASCRGSVVVVAEVMDLCHFGVVAKIIRHEPRVLVSLLHAEAQCFEGPADHPARMGVELGTDGASQRLDGFDDRSRTERSTSYQVGMTAHILG